MTGGKRLRIAALFVIVLVFAFIMDMSSNAITDNTLIRNDTGDGDAVYDLVLNADGLDEDYSYQLKVREEQPSDKQANELFTQAKKEIDDSFCEENQSVEQVRGHVIMKDAYASGAVEAEWTLSDYDVVDINGDVNQDAFEEVDDEQGKLISASVELSCGEHRQLYDFSFVVFPDELDAGERLIKGINRHIDSEMSKTGTKKLTLPDEVDGVKLSWSQEKSNTAAKIAMLEVVVIVLLVLEKKEKKKTAQKERNIQLQLEYPEIVSKMAVLMGSGMTVEQAWNRITARYLDERKNNDKNIMPAYEEMLVTEREISHLLCCNLKCTRHCFDKGSGSGSALIVDFVLHNRAVFVKTDNTAAVRSHVNNGVGIGKHKFCASCCCADFVDFGVAPFDDFAAYAGNNQTADVCLCNARFFQSLFINSLCCQICVELCREQSHCDNLVVLNDDSFSVLTATIDSCGYHICSSL